ncbi:MAG: carbohydrate ABC transporter permease [Candidatus Hydrothermales bacterium]
MKRYLLLLFFSLLYIFPFYFMLLVAFRPEVLALSMNLLPSNLTFENFVRIFKYHNFGRYFINSLIVAFSGASISTFLAFICAYSFAKENFLFKGFLYNLFVSTLLVPGILFMIPQFLIVVYLRWLDTFLGLVVPHLANVFGFIFLTEYIKKIPDDLIYAAIIDGASKIRIIFNIIFPLSMPMLLTIFLLNFQFHWNNFLWQLLVTTKNSMFTIPVGLNSLTSMYQEYFGAKMAGASLSIVPVVLLFLIFQRYFIQGIIRGGLKF